MPYSMQVYFNSIKVQLKPEFQKICRYAFLFQFHKGTIKTILHVTIVI